MAHKFLIKLTVYFRKCLHTVNSTALLQIQIYINRISFKLPTIWDMPTRNLPGPIGLQDQINSNPNAARVLQLDENSHYAFAFLTVREILPF